MLFRWFNNTQPLRQNNGSFEAFVILCYYTEYGRNSGWKSKLKMDIYCQSEVVKSFIKLRLWNGVGSYCKSHDKQTEFLSARLKDAFAAGSYTLYTVVELRSYTKGILNTK